MPSLKPSEIDDLLVDEEELTEVDIRRKKRKEKKLGGIKPLKIRTDYDTNEGA